MGLIAYLKDKYNEDKPLAIIGTALVVPVLVASAVGIYGRIIDTLREPIHYVDHVTSIQDYTNACGVIQGKEITITNDPRPIRIPHNRWDNTVTINDKVEITAKERILLKTLDGLSISDNK